MKISFSLAFLLVGLPMLFILREYVPIDKKLFTYSMIGLNLLLLINYKNLFSLSFYFNIPLSVKFIIFVIIGLFSFISIYTYGFNDQSIYLLITLYIYMSFFTIRGEELKDFFKFLLIISSITVYLAFFTTPLDAVYWADKGGRLYLGDTKNASVVSTLTAINLICIFFYLTKENKKRLHIIILLPLLFISPYLYLLSQGKSTIIGIILILVYLFINSLSNIKRNVLKYLKYIFSLTIVLYFFYIYFQEFIANFFNIIISAGLSLFGLKSNLIQRSAEIRNMNFEKTLDYMSLDNLIGYGINTFRMDSPFLQTAIDFGNIIAIMFFFVAIIFPLFYILKINYKTLERNSKLAILLYIFYFQNFFFHGTPYEYSIWLPLLIFIKLISSNKYRL